VPDGGAVVVDADVAVEEVELVPPQAAETRATAMRIPAHPGFSPLLPVRFVGAGVRPPDPRDFSVVVVSYR
jgi:hypothetical protein